MYRLALAGSCRVLLRFLWRDGVRGAWGIIVLRVQVQGLGSGVWGGGFRGPSYKQRSCDRLVVQHYSP